MLNHFVYTAGLTLIEKRPTPHWGDKALCLLGRVSGYKNWMLCLRANHQELRLAMGEPYTT